VAEEEDRLIQEAVARVLLSWVAKEVVQVVRHFHEEVEVVAFLQQQDSTLDRKNPLEAAEGEHRIEQAEAVDSRKFVCHRKQVVREICLCLLKVEVIQHLLPKESSEAEVEVADPALLSWSHDFSKASSARQQTCQHLQAEEEP
jgi:hypothetical protein